MGVSTFTTSSSGAPLASPRTTDYRAPSKRALHSRFPFHEGASRSLSCSFSESGPQSSLHCFFLSCLFLLEARSRSTNRELCKDAQHRAVWHEVMFFEVTYFWGNACKSFASSKKAMFVWGSARHLHQKTMLLLLAIWIGKCVTGYRIKPKLKSPHIASSVTIWQWTHNHDVTSLLLGSFFRMKRPLFKWIGKCLTGSRIKPKIKSPHIPSSVTIWQRTYSHDVTSLLYLEWEAYYSSRWRPLCCTVGWATRAWLLQLKHLPLCLFAMTHKSCSQTLIACL